MKAQNRIINELRLSLKQYSDIDIEAIFFRLEITNNGLKMFLHDSKTAMVMGDINVLKNIVMKRERSIKGASRAKTVNAGSFDKNKWFGGTYLDYRFAQAKQLIREIWDGEMSNV